MTIYDLNEKYFLLYSRLNDNREFVSVNAYKAMSHALDKQYDNELRMLTGALALDTAEADFIQRYRIRRYIPRRLLFGYNRIGRAFMRRAKAEFRDYLVSVLSDALTTDPTEEQLSTQQPPEEPPQSTLPAVHPVCDVTNETSTQQQ